MKQLWGFTKVRYRGLAKNLARAFTLFALANLYRSAGSCGPRRRGASRERPVGSGEPPASSAGAGE